MHHVKYYDPYHRQSIHKEWPAAEIALVLEYILDLRYKDVAYEHYFIDKPQPPGGQHAYTF